VTPFWYLSFVPLLDALYLQFLPTYISFSLNACYHSQVSSVQMDSPAGWCSITHCEKHDKLPQKGECFIHQASDVASKQPWFNPRWLCCLGCSSAIIYWYINSCVRKAYHPLRTQSSDETCCCCCHVSVMSRWHWLVRRQTSSTTSNYSLTEVSLDISTQVSHREVVLDNSYIYVAVGEPFSFSGTGTWAIFPSAWGHLATVRTSDLSLT